MVSVPGFLLRRLYVKGSLKNTPEGFEFQLRNGLGSGYAYKLWPLKLDDVALSTDSTYFLLEGRKVAFSEVSNENTFTLAMNKTIIIRAEGVALESGARKLEMGFDVPGLGTLRFDFTEGVASG